MKGWRDKSKDHCLKYNKFYRCSPVWKVWQNRRDLGGTTKKKVQGQGHENESQWHKGIPICGARGTFLDCASSVTRKRGGQKFGLPTYRHRTFRHRTFRHNHFVTQTYRHTDISSHGHFVTGQNVTRTFRHRTKRHTDISSHGHFVTTISSHRHIVTRTFHHTGISSPDKTSHGHFVTGQNVTRTYRHRTFRHRTFRHRTFRHNHFVTQTYRHTDISSHGHFVTGQNVTRTYRHRTFRHKDLSSHGHFVTGLLVMFYTYSQNSGSFCLIPFVNQKFSGPKLRNF